MGKHLDKVIELEYTQFIIAHTEKFDSDQAVSFKQGLRENLKREIKEEILPDVTKAVEKDFEIKYQKEKVGNIKTLTIVGILLSFLVGLAVNQCTECLTLFKHLFRACQENCVNGYVRISRLEPVCQIVWQIDLLLKPNF